MRCGKCGFVLSEEMRFSIRNNVCPSCGNMLLSKGDTDMISLIRERLASKSFSESLSEDLIFDISNFTFNELKNGVGLKLIEQEVYESQKAFVDENGEVSKEAVERTKELVRKQVMDELLNKSAKEAIEDDMGMDDDLSVDRIDRLKALAKKRKVSSSKHIRRVDS